MARAEEQDEDAEPNDQPVELLLSALLRVPAHSHLTVAGGKVETTVGGSIEEGPVGPCRSGEHPQASTPTTMPKPIRRNAPAMNVSLDGPAEDLPSRDAEEQYPVVPRSLGNPDCNPVAGWRQVSSPS
jgi:hypothetical protein